MTKSSTKPEAAQAKLSCREALQWVFDYIDEGLDPAREGEVRVHIASCRSCFERYEFEKLLKERIQTIELATPSDEIKKRLRAVLE